jgi:hypothetical protein
MDGICTLANDYVLDQVIALLNSVEVHAPGMPVCIYPYDDCLTELQNALAGRENVNIYEDHEAIQSWDSRVRQAWDAHPVAKQRWQNAGSSGYHRVGTHRRYCAFDGPFDRFIYMDADTILLDSPQTIFSTLNQADFVVYDFQFKDPSHVYELSAPKLNSLFSPEQLESAMFCSGFYGASKHLFQPENLEQLLHKLRSGEAEVLYPMAPDQTLLNYMVMRSNLTVNNLALTLPLENRTGCCVTSSHFEQRGDLLYDHDNRLTYLHYIGISSRFFKRLCQGENIDLPYRDIFLHYRYLHEPESQPRLTGKAKPYNAPPTLIQRALKKLGIT